LFKLEDPQIFEKSTDFYRTLRNNKKQKTPCMETVLHTSDDCIFITEDYGNSWKVRVIDAGRNFRCCIEEETSECRRGPPVGILCSLIYAEIGCWKF